MVRRAMCVALLLGGALAGGITRAQAPGFALVWVAPAGCPSRSEVLARAERLTGRRMDVDGAVAERVEGSVERLGSDLWELHVLSQPSRGMDRTVRAPTCSELADAVALIVALSSWSSSASPAPHSTTSAAPSAAAVATRAPGETPPAVVGAEPAVVGAEPAVVGGEPANGAAPSGREGTSARSRAQVAGLVAATLGRLPEVAPGVAVEVGLWRARWLGLARGAVFPKRSVRRSDASGGDLWMGSVALGLGYELVGRPSLVPYALAELSLVHGDGVRAPLADSGNTALVAVGIGAMASYAVSPWWAFLMYGEATLLALRPGFTLGGTDLSRPDRVGGQMGLGVLFRGW